MKLRDWIPFEKLDKENLLQNPSAIHLIMNFDENIIKADFTNEKRLLRNSNLMDFLIYKKDKYWVKKDNKWVNELSFIDLFKILFGNIDHLWFTLSKNPSVIDILKEYPDKINWRGLSFNPAAIDLLKANPSKIYWDDLYDNIAATELLNDNPEFKEQWQYWCHLSMNPNAIRLLKQILKILMKKLFFIIR
jgi:hypothetical protein